MPQVDTGKATSRARRLEVTSPAFEDGERIPVKFTADGDDVSPPLRWGDPPTGTRTLAVVCEDPDAPSGLFVHWTAWNLRPEMREVREGFAGSEAEASIAQGRNGFGNTGYGGPKPPPGKPHRYQFRIYALDA